MVEDQTKSFPCSGEINFKVADAKKSIERIMSLYADLNPSLDFTDGVSAEFPEWRFNLRSSNTEPLLRLNVESRKNPDLMRQRTAEISELISFN
jgi:phosphomannomutase/phosphoglucomutase